MEPMIGALVAAGTAMASILIAIRLPERYLPIDRLRVVGGLSLALLGLVILGAPLPGDLPTIVLALGLVFAALLPRPQLLRLLGLEDAYEVRVARQRAQLARRDALALSGNRGTRVRATLRNGWPTASKRTLHRMGSTTMWMPHGRTAAPFTCPVTC